MGEDSGKRKFPKAIPNPALKVVAPAEQQAPSRQPSRTRSPAAPAPFDDRTDPAIELKEQADESSYPSFSLGPLDPLMRDPEISEIMVNDIRNVIVEKEGRLLLSKIRFETQDDLQRLVNEIIRVTGASIDPERPMLDIMLPDGSRANIVLPPLAVHGPSLTIRKFPHRQYAATDLMIRGMLDQKILAFLNACVLGRLNIVISGGTGSGKTTLLNALTAIIPPAERIIMIEDTPELVVSHPNCVRMQAKMKTASAPGVYVRDLVANALRMRPDRIIVGECRRSEAMDMLQAMNTGHQGSMTTLHANSPREALTRLETLYLMAGVDVPSSAVRRQIASAVDLVVQVKRFRSGKRRITAISEVTGMQGDAITLQDIFIFETEQREPGQQPAKPPVERFRSTGLVPTFIEQLRELGIELPKDFFA